MAKSKSTVNVKFNGAPAPGWFSAMFQVPVGRVRDLPETEREAFNEWLNGQTVPWLDDVPDEEQDGYYRHDYERWKRGLPVVD